VSAPQQALSGDQGATFRAILSIENSDSSLFNFTGYTAQMEIRATYPQADPPLLNISTTSSASGSLTLGGAAGTIAIYIPASVMQTLPIAFPNTPPLPTVTYYYDIFATNTGGNGDTIKVAYGTFSITEAITRP
jgi:hypothetical protein